MKKLICLLICLMMIISCVPALAASLAPEKVIGTWVMNKLELDGTAYENEALKELGIDLGIKFHADGTGDISVKSTSENSTKALSWRINGNECIVEIESEETALSMNGKALVIGDDQNKIWLSKTSDTTDKIVTKAITSQGTYKLNNSKKTAALAAPANRKASSLKIPDTITANGKSYKVTEIGAKACGGMTKLTTLTVGKNVKKIGKSAFTGSKKLKKITFSGTALTKVGSGAFSDAKKTVTVICPKAKLAKYKKLLLKSGLSNKAKFKGK